jgi:glutamate formiminotransferase
MDLVECIPNFSEGRRLHVVDAIVAAAEGVAGVQVLDRGQDADHNRAVVTLAGTPEVVGEAAFRAVARAAELIDLRRHTGVHPRIGAADVCPFVPLGETSMGVCVTLARDIGGRVGDELGIPVYFYGEAALVPSRRSLPAVRRGGFEALADALGSDPERAPDAGPRDAIHPTAGAIAIGARPFLIAFNVNLDTTDVGLARRIAGRIRERDGGLPGVRALGLELTGAGFAQVSTNVCDFRRTGLGEVFEAVERYAGEAGVAVRESELIGLAPRAALDAGLADRIALRDFDPARQILENRIAR